MNPTKKTKLEDLERIQQAQHRWDGMSSEELVNDKLTQLQAFIRNLANTPNGQLEIQQRTIRFGTCERGSHETTSQYYGKLRQWLDR